MHLSWFKKFLVDVDFFFFFNGGNGPENNLLSPYDEAMEALSSLITKRTRADKSNSGDRFDLMYDYVKVS